MKLVNLRVLAHAVFSVKINEIGSKLEPRKHMFHGEIKTLDGMCLVMSNALYLLKWHQLCPQAECVTVSELV